MQHIPFYFYTDINECIENIHSCDKNATCRNNKGSYGCGCDIGYSGDGLICNGK